MQGDIIKEFYFDEYFLRSRESLWKKGAIVHFPPKELLFLSILIENAGNIIAKERLVSEVWKGGVVNDESLSRCAYSVRKILEKNSRKKYIETVYGKGFVFSHPVSCSLKESLKKSTGSNVIMLLPEADRPVNNFHKFSVAIRKLIPKTFEFVPYAIAEGYLKKNMLETLIDQYQAIYVIRYSFLSENKVLLKIYARKHGEDKFIEETIFSADDKHTFARLRARFQNFVEDINNNFPICYPMDRTDKNGLLSNKKSPLERQGYLSSKSPDNNTVDDILNMADHHIDVLLKDNMIGFRRVFYKIQELIENVLFVEPLNALALAIMGLVKTIGQQRFMASHLLSQAKQLAAGNETINFYYAWHLVLKGDLEMAMDTLQYVEFTGKEKSRALLLKKHILSQKNHPIKEASLNAEELLIHSHRLKEPYLKIREVKSINIECLNIKCTRCSA